MLGGDQGQGRDCERSALQDGTLIVDFTCKASAGRVIRDCARWSKLVCRAWPALVASGGTGQHSRADDHGADRLLGGGLRPLRGNA
jgi:hypothetical protein